MDFLSSYLNDVSVKILFSLDSCIEKTYNTRTCAVILNIFWLITESFSYQRPHTTMPNTVLTGDRWRTEVHWQHSALQVGPQHVTVLCSPDSREQSTKLPQLLWGICSSHGIHSISTNSRASRQDKCFQNMNPTKSMFTFWFWTVVEPHDPFTVSEY